MTVFLQVSSNSEWRAVKEVYSQVDIQSSPYGEWFSVQIAEQTIIFLHGGVGKIAAAGSTQYAIDRWRPSWLINLGTCGGLAGQIERGTIVLAVETLVYDIIELMGDPQAPIERYTSRSSLPGLVPPYPSPVRPIRLLSADRDICVEDLPMLRQRYDAVACDWESGAIAWVAARNNLPCLILRGVTDLVGEAGGEAYHDDITVYHTNARTVMHELLKVLPAWLERIFLTD